MRRLLTSVAMLTMVLALQAIPAKRGVWKTITLADGTSVRAEQCGDEHLSFWKAADGACYQLGPSGRYEQIDLKAKVAQTAERREAANQRRAARRQAAAKAAYTGTKKGLVILVDFPDKTFQAGHDNAYYQDVVNKEGFTNSEGYVGSVHDYFHAQSGGQFDLTFDVAGPYTMEKPSTYYGQNVEYYGQTWKDRYVADMISAACRAANPDVNYQDYDWDGDGAVDQVYVLYAGDNEAALSDQADLIWPHESSLSGYLTLDNKRIRTYATGSELTGGMVDGIGTFAHEFSHCLGLMDSYDTEYNGGYGMGSWDVMCQGTYNGGGKVPAGYTSYEKAFCGWLTPTELTGEVDVTDMKAQSEGGEAYIIYNKANSNEFYMLENRQRTGWDALLPGSGLLIIHVDYNSNIWRNNTINADPAHQRYTIFHADNTASYGNESTDPYPYRTNNRLTDTSTPAATLFNNNADGRKYMGYPICDIKQNDGLVSFHAGSIVEVDLNGPAIPVEGALFYESFDQCDGLGANDGMWDVTGIANSNATFHPDNEGWFYNTNTAFGGDRCVKFGSNRYKGTVRSPEFTIDGPTKLVFKAASWMTDGTNLKLTVTDNATLSESQFTMAPDKWTVCETVITGTGTVQVTFWPDNRFFLDEVVAVKDEGDAIVSVAADSRRADDRIFTIDGRYVGSDASRLQRGLYIRSGRKFVVE